MATVVQPRNFETILELNPVGTQWAYAVHITGLPYWWTTGEDNWIHTEDGDTLIDKPCGLGIRDFTLDFVTNPLSPLETGSGLTVKILDDDSCYLRSFFAPKGGAETRQTANLGAASSDTTLTVIDSGIFTVFATDEYIYIGNETLKATALPSSTTATVTRDALGTLRTEHKLLTETVGSLVSTSPRVFRGRFLELWIAPVNDGDGTIDTDNEQMIWAGRITSGPRSYGTHYEISAEPLSSIFETNFPRALPQGFIGAVIPGEEPYVIFHSTESTLISWLVKATGTTGGLIPESGGSTNIELGSFDFYAGGNTFTKLSDSAFPQIHSLSFVLKCISDTIEQFNSTSSITSEDIAIYYDWVTSDSGKNIQITMTNWSATHDLVFNQFVSNKLMNEKLVVGSTAPAHWFTPLEANAQNSAVFPISIKAMVVSKGDNDIAVWLDEADRPFDPAAYKADSSSTAKGYARIKAGDQVEIFSFTGISTPQAGRERLRFLTGCTRGIINTTPNTWASPNDDGTFDANAQDARVEQIMVLEAPDTENKFTPADILMRILISTGDFGQQQSNEDALGVGFGLAMPFKYVDRLGFIQAEKFVGQPQFTAFIVDEAKKGKEAVEELLKQAGLHLTARRYGVEGTTTTGFGISLASIEPVNQTQYQQNLDESHRARGSEVEIDWNERLIINTVKHKGIFNPLTSEFVESKFNFYHDSSIADYGEEKAIEISTRGLTSSDFYGFRVYGLNFRPVVVEAGRRWLSAFARGNYTVTVETTHIGWLFQAGEKVSITLTGVDNADGTDGLSDIIGRVIAASHTHGSNAGATITLRSPLFTTNELAPCGLVTAESGSTITISNNFFSDSDEFPPYAALISVTRDHHWFNRALHAQDIDIWIWPEGNWDLGEERTIVSNVGSILTLNSAVSGTIQALIAGGTIRITFTEWDNQTSAFAQKYAHIADNGDGAGTPPTLGTAEDTSKEWA